MKPDRDLGLAAVARVAGVSAATVSNVINRPHMVSAETQERVRRAITELDFVPNRAAATLRQGTNRLLGLVIPDVANPFYSAIASAVADAADRHRFTLALCPSHEDHDRELRHFEMLAEQRAAGALVVPMSADASRLNQLRMVGTRLVLVDRIAPSDDGCSVAIDDVQGGTLATAHLLASGAPRITLVNGPRSIPQCDDRRTGARQAFEAVGLAPQLVEYESEHMVLAEGEEIGRRIAEDGAPLSIFCTNDQLAIGVIRGLATAGIRTPADARVVGYGDLAIAEMSTLPLTSVAQPKADLGSRAVELLMAELHDGPGHQHHADILSPRLIVRESAP
ncbi:LacI family DNA-binding transcriptional regulator [Herbiconiux sp. KACC 21604]|uniref:LacI family DNA-binding transcriptional regulator n=1 Tax=unclassified Herbiconiux TaxID=2618217 RepID=UPI001492343B|nr:LacI family DNA-binding transcriptional regulator [Herbiconiux sp. SALV-R1]QJU55694.1 LacI family DNA-binding transcriptional regulator [Herbiconiux sp. SALV-R1]WPO86897.1 LacI family DNA-binding transcriptional regulator [Herbiconiux sp. KACC 21604]